MSQPAYPDSFPVSAVVERLALATSHPSHEFWTDDISLLDSGRFNTRHVHGPRQITDVYLLALAVKHDAAFATFDRTVPLSAVSSARTQHLIVI